MTEDQATVFVVDDDISVRDSLESVIRWAGWKARTFSTAEAFLSRAESDGPCCTVLDVDLPDLNGLELQKRIGDRMDMPIIFITGVGDIPMSVRAMKAGAVEFLTKPLSDQVVLDAMRQAIARSRAARDQEADTRSLRQRYTALTNRQREVMSLVISGLLNKEIGARLGMSEITVKVHRGKVMRKMKADSLADLVRMAARLELPLAVKA